ncbi:MAG: tetratricopeptide repeat protein [Deltaproteobacteria bacterium]|nr:tetratricopeptide repeat protein [Deltaproteobacteria bacterium]
MAKDEKLTRHDLKEEDIYVSTVNIVMDWIAKHRVQVIAALAAVVAIVAIREAAVWWIERQNTAASTLLFDAMKAASPAEDEQAPAARTVSPEKKAEAVRGYEKVIAEYPSSEVAHAARVQIAALKYDLDENDAALKSAAEYLKATPEDHRFRRMALEIKGYALLRKGDANGAADAFRRIADGKGMPGRDYALLDLGYALEKAGDKKGAAEAFRRIAAEHPRSTLKERAGAKADELDPAGKAQSEAEKKPE